MKIKISASVIDGNVSAPPSKSAMQRACALALLCKGKTNIYNPGISNDDEAAISIIKNLGAKVNIINSNFLNIESNGIEPISDNIYCNESGLSIRMFTPLIALSDKKINITGGGSLSTRPMGFFDEIFPQLIIQIKSNEGKLPISIKGILQAKNISIDGALSSQFLTGLIFAFVYAEKKSPVTITVKNLKSKPYIDLTLDVLKKFGINVEHKNYEHFYFDNTQKLNLQNEYTVEGDWSGAAFLLVAGAIAGKVSVQYLDIQSTQGDKKILEAIKDAGASIVLDKNNICITKNQLNAFKFDATDCPDLFPPLVALAVRCNGVSTIKGVNRLQFKESNRGITLQEEFGKLGYKILLQDDIMQVHGTHQMVAGGIEVFAHHDHRIAMALGLAALHTIKSIIIENADSINKSYPNYFKDLATIGVLSEVV